MSEEVTFKALSTGNGGIAYSDDDAPSTIVNVPPRLGRSKIFAREELMYANNQPAHQQYQRRTSANLGYRGPPQKNTGIQGPNPADKLIQQCSESQPRRPRTGGSRRAATKDNVDFEDDNPLQRYENALSRYRKSAHGGPGSLRKDRREPHQKLGNIGYSSSDDSEGATPRYNKSKSTSSIDTQSVNNILDEYEDLDYGRSSDLSDSGSISVTNFEVVMDQRKRHQQQQQNTQVERSNETVANEDVCRERQGQPYDDQHSKNTSERADPLFKVNQQTQVRQRSRDRQSATANNPAVSKETVDKFSPGCEEQMKSGQDASSATSENRCVAENRAVVKQAPEVLRKGEVQKRVDEWLSQTQAQNFSGPNGDKRESGRAVALVRSSSSAESKNLRRSRNDARSRSTDENSVDKLNGTASYDDINRTEATRPERKLERPKNIAVVGATRGTYKDYLAGRNRSRHPTDYGFVGHGSVARPGEPISGGSRIPQRGQVHSRRREVSNDRKSADHRMASNETSVKATPVASASQQEKKLSLGLKPVAAEVRNTSGGFGKTRMEQVSCNGATIASTSILANGRAASFKRARSQERNNAIAPGRNTGALVKEDQQATTTGNPRMRSGSQHHQHHSQIASKGQLSRIDQLQKQQNSLTSPNKVGESRRLLVASREPRAHEDSIEQACKPVDQLIKPQQQQQQFAETNETKGDTAAQTQDTHFAKYVGQSRCATSQGEKEKLVEDPGNPTIESPSFSGGPRVLRSPDESRTSRSRLIRENSGGLEPRRPPAPPRRDQSRRKKTESTSIRQRQTTDEPCSSFRPTKRLYSALRQTHEQNSFATGFDTRGPTCELSSAKSHYAAPKQVEKIYERSLQPQVIHSNDLESILKPVVRASAYGESAESGSMKTIEDSSCLSDNPILGEIADSFLEGMDKAEEHRSSESPKTARYPEIGLDQCLQVQRRHPTMKNPSKESSLEKRGLPTIHTKCCNQELIIEPAKTFGTFQPASPIKPSGHLDDQSEEKETSKNDHDIDEQTSLDVANESTGQEAHLIPTLKISLIDSYEARSTLRLDRHFPSSGSKDLNLDSQIDEGPLGGDVAATNPLPVSEFDTHDTEEKKLLVQDNTGGEQRAIVNEVLVKNLRFQQDLPKPEFQNVFRAAKPFNFNSVLSDDYDKNQADDCATDDKECEIYVTKEEMERQRLMDFLEKGDFESVKLARGVATPRAASSEVARSEPQSLTIGCLQSAGLRGSSEGDGGTSSTRMCCVLQGADRVCPSTTGGKHSGSTLAGNGSRGTMTSSPAAQDLPLESLWAAGLDEGMGFPQRCSYAHQRTLSNNTNGNQNHGTNPEELWRDRSLSHRTPTTSAGIDTSINDEIWTSASERKYFRTSTTSTGIGSSINLHENNRSLESRDGDYYQSTTDADESKDSYRKYYPTTPTTSGLGSSSERQSVETQRSADLPDHLWAAAMEDGFSRFNAMKSLQTITRQPRPNHDWVKTERISRFTKHRTISQQSPQREQEIWTSRLNEINVSGYATQRVPQHRCHHQTRRSFSTSIVADLAGTSNNGSQQSLGSGEFLELERSYTLSTPGGGSPVCCPPCSPPPAPAAYISSVRASSRRLPTGNGLGGPSSPDRDPLAKLLRYLKTFYRELGTRDPRHLPPWASPLPLGTLCPAHFQPHLQLVHKSEQEHRLENIKIDQIFAPVRGTNSGFEVDSRDTKASLPSSEEYSDVGVSGSADVSASADLNGSLDICVQSCACSCAAQLGISASGSAGVDGQGASASGDASLNAYLGSCDSLPDAGLPDDSLPDDSPPDASLPDAGLPDVPSGYAYAIGVHRNSMVYSNNDVVYTNSVEENSQPVTYYETVDVDHPFMIDGWLWNSTNDLLTIPGKEAINACLEYEEGTWEKLAIDIILKQLSPTGSCPINPLSDGTISEAPRRVAVEGGPGSGRTTLCLRLLHQWATQGDGPALAFIVPLRELRGSPLLNYLDRELFPRTSALGDAVAQVWRTLHLMEDRVLFVLDGYDECLGGRASLGDAADLLEGRLFPDARILVTCGPGNVSTLSPLVQRRIHLAGLEWAHVERLCVAYFIHNDLAERACEFLEALSVQSTPVKQLVQHPLGWVMVCALYQDSGSLPSEASALVQAAVKCIVRRSLDRPVPSDEEIPGHCRKRLEDFGKLALSALREGRSCYTEAELRARGGGIEVTRLGFLTRGLNFGQRRKTDLYTPIHMAIGEFLAAYYLTSIAQYSNILRRELEGLPSGIIGHLAALLGPKTHLILNQLSPLEVPPRTVFSLLKAAGASDGNISAVCRLVGAGPGFGPAPNDRPLAPLVQTSPLELAGWTRILESSACTLEALEVVFQIERGSEPSYLNDFFEALAANESVKLVRITSLLGQDFAADEAQRLAGHLKSVLSKKRLNDFELVITCLEESAHDRLECVVNALCRGLKHASNHLARLVLDMNLSGDQVSRVCAALRDCVQVQALHLPHLSCGCEGLAAVAELLKERPLLALNLAGSWGAKNEDPSSSGISMGSGSGSGSSGCASSTLGTLPLNRCYSSLPRGALAAYGSMTRPATLPRLPLGLGLGPSPGSGNALPTNDRDRDSNGSSKRNSDSVLCHRLPLMHPLPTCDVSSHQGTGFHEIFNAIREPNCKLRSLNVSKCLQGGLDAGCLGETIRRARYLDALRASGASRPADVMPLVLALTEAPCLQLLDLASPRLALDDHPSRLLCHALARNATLRLLSLEGWTFRIEESDSLAVFSELLKCTSVRELSLCNARLHLAVHEGPLSRLGRRDDAGAELLRAAPPPACPTIVFLRLAGFQVTVNDRPALRGPLLLPFLAGFTSLSELDLSLDKSEIGGSSSSLLFIDDKILQHFFACFSANFRNLQSLRINYWRISLEDSERTMRQISKNLKLCNVSFLKVNGLIVTDSAKKMQMEHVFLQTVLANLQNLTWLCLDGVKLTESQASSVGKCIRDRYPGTGLEISAKDVHVRSIKSLVSAIEDAGRAEVVYTGGSSCRLKITKVPKNGKAKKK